MPASADIRMPNWPSADSVKAPVRLPNWLKRVFMAVSRLARPKGGNRFNCRQWVASSGTPVQLVDCQDQR
ncbi:hypothetical protein ACVWXM_009214 [Bradyrhizobium sp. GM7.3]